MYTQIIELTGRTETGVSVKPFICMTEKGRKIYLKTAGVLGSSLIAEWLGGRLAELMTLGCADIAIIEVPEMLAKANLKPEWSEFKAGVGFGSYAMPSGYRDLMASDIGRLKEAHLAELFLFDYWIQNLDRIMGPVAGNPNALVSSDLTELIAIDHDNAFDVDFDAQAMDKHHIGRSVRHYWRDKHRQESWLNRARVAISVLDEIWGELPEEWVYSDLDNTNSEIYTKDYYRRILEKPLRDSADFWKGLLQ